MTAEGGAEPHCIRYTYVWDEIDRHGLLSVPSVDGTLSISAMLLGDGSVEVE